MEKITNTLMAEDTLKHLPHHLNYVNHYMSVH